MQLLPGAGVRLRPASSSTPGGTESGPDARTRSLMAATPRARGPRRARRARGQAVVTSDGATVADGRHRMIGAYLHRGGQQRRGQRFALRNASAPLHAMAGAVSVLHGPVGCVLGLLARDVRPARPAPARPGCEPTRRSSPYSWKGGYKNGGLAGGSHMAAPVEDSEFAYARALAQADPFGERGRTGAPSDPDAPAHPAREVTVEDALTSQRISRSMSPATNSRSCGSSPAALTSLKAIEREAYRRELRARTWPSLGSTLPGDRT